MRKFAILLCCITVWGSSFTTVRAQFNNNNEKKKIYKVNLAIDLPVAVVGTALTGYGFKKIGEKTGPSLETVNALNYEEELSGFNRFFMPTPNYNESAAKVSDVLFYGAMPLGLGLAVDKNIRSDFGTVMLMYWEALALTGAIYANTAANVIKYRPLAYPGSGAPESERTIDGAKNSFPGGHPTITAASTFFIATVIKDYYPDRKGLHIAAYSTASALTLTNALLRHKAGKHFASDLLVGLSYSVPIGILVPYVHKIANKNDRISFYNSADGMTFAYVIE